MTAAWDERQQVSDERYRADEARFTGEASDFARWAVERLRPYAGVRDVLELGCGPGRDSRYLAVEGFRVQGVDFSSVAIARAVDGRRAMPEPFRSRLAFVEGEATRFLEGRPAASADVVFAHLVYATFTQDELRRLFAQVHRVLRAGGRHLYAVRDRTDPHAKEGVEVAPGTWRGGPHPVDYHYFTLAELEALAKPLFLPAERFRSPSAHLLFALDRRAEAPQSPSAAGAGGGG